MNFTVKAQCRGGITSPSTSLVSCLCTRITATYSSVLGVPTRLLPPPSTPQPFHSQAVCPTTRTVTNIHNVNATATANACISTSTFVRPHCYVLRSTQPGLRLSFISDVRRDSRLRQRRFSLFQPSRRSVTNERPQTRSEQRK